MTTLSFLIAFAIAGGQVTFAGAVATPTAASVPVVVHASKTATGQQVSAQTGRFDDPPRVVSTRPMDSDADRTVVLVTYL